MLASSNSEPGKRLRALRERLHLSTRTVERLSEKLARDRKDRSLFLSHNWVTDVENGRFVPGFMKLYSLSLIYHSDIADLLEWFGMNLRDFSRERSVIALPHTHLMTEARDDAPRTATVVRDPSQWAVLKRTNLVHRTLEIIEALPLFQHQHSDPRNTLYGYVGTEDYTLDPLVRPGSIVQIDPRQTNVSVGTWENEHDRPIYFTELRDDRYVCSWCERDGSYLLLIPSPQSHMAIRHLRHPDDARIVGRVTAVTMRIAEPRSS